MPRLLRAFLESPVPTELDTSCLADEPPAYVEKPVEELYNGALDAMQAGDYEEAAAQGLFAGVNAALQCLGRETWVPRRDTTLVLAGPRASTRSTPVSSRSARDTDADRDHVTGGPSPGTKAMGARQATRCLWEDLHINRTGEHIPCIGRW